MTLPASPPCSADCSRAPIFFPGCKNEHEGSEGLSQSLCHGPLHGWRRRCSQPALLPVPPCFDDDTMTEAPQLFGKLIIVGEPRAGQLQWAAAARGNLAATGGCKHDVFDARSALKSASGRKTAAGRPAAAAAVAALHQAAAPAASSRRSFCSLFDLFVAPRRPRAPTDPRRRRRRRPLLAPCRSRLACPSLLPCLRRQGWGLRAGVPPGQDVHPHRPVSAAAAAARRRRQTQRLPAPPAGMPAAHQPPALLALDAHPRSDHSCDIRIVNKEISRKHAEVYVEDNGAVRGWPGAAWLGRRGTPHTPAREGLWHAAARLVPAFVALHAMLPAAPTHPRAPTARRSSSPAWAASRWWSTARP